jgi:two-component system cell cycle response regulator DivK
MSFTILVIEDNLQNLYLMRFLLESHGYTVLSATDGLDGIEMAGRLHPDCILLDIQLPKLDGYGVAVALRADRSLAAIPIIAVTSYAMIGDREKALESGANDYVEKPIDPATFVDRIRKHLPSEPTLC